jgi:hypothetical protein
MAGPLHRCPDCGARRSARTMPYHRTVCCPLTEAAMQAGIAGQVRSLTPPACDMCGVTVLPNASHCPQCGNRYPDHYGRG